MNYLEHIEDWLMGRLSPEHEGSFATALARDPNLQLAVNQAEEALSITWLAMSTPVEPSASLHERLFTSIAPKSNGLLGFASYVAELLHTTRDYAEHLLNQIAIPDEWIPGPAPGTHIFHIEGLPLAETAIVGFVKIEPGVEFPHHTHVGVEQCLILEGALYDDDEQRLYERGQLAVQPSDSGHVIRAHGDEPLIYLTIVDRGIRLLGQFYIGPGDPEI